MESLRHFLLIVRGLNAQAKYFGFQRFEFLVVISKRTSLWSTTSRPGNLIPSVRQGHIGLTGHWITVDHQEVLERTNINLFSVCG